MNNEIIWQGKPFQGFIFRNIDFGLVFVGTLLSFFIYHLCLKTEKQHESTMFYYYKIGLGYFMITYCFIRFFIDFFYRKFTTITLKKDKIEIQCFKNKIIVNFDYIKLEKHPFNIYSINYRIEKDYITIKKPFEYGSGIDFFYDNNAIFLKKKEAKDLYNLIQELKNEHSN
ncbi:hypothetical protein [Flavobacterium sp. NRK F7]|uniref:hypothetical protein n=1 Tax=Flavobacterium sp. NRK F7 TaxID=2954930 RepID=UPI0020915F2A|nr:hypothetical protein [Flavobacterium sp. NRK F7]MCO6162840.1 hypothetical protein [Flavobacterium sp. NRK F7]